MSHSFNASRESPRAKRAWQRGISVKNALMKPKIRHEGGAMNWMRLSCVLLALAVAFAADRWLAASEQERRDAEMAHRYSSVVGGMTVEQVRQVMGKQEDQPTERKTTTGEFERSWSFMEEGWRITVVFDKDGRSTYIEHGPTDCGVTPLQGKYIKSKWASQPGLHLQPTSLDRGRSLRRPAAARRYILGAGTWLEAISPCPMCRLNRAIVSRRAAAGHRNAGVAQEGRRVSRSHAT
jgi:hypothetical protein